MSIEGQFDGGNDQRRSAGLVTGLGIRTFLQKQRREPGEAHAAEALDPLARRAIETKRFESGDSEPPVARSYRRRLLKPLRRRSTVGSSGTCMAAWNHRWLAQTTARPAEVTRIVYVRALIRAVGVAPAAEGARAPERRGSHESRLADATRLPVRDREFRAA